MHVELTQQQPWIADHVDPLRLCVRVCLRVRDLKRRRLHSIPVCPEEMTQGEVARLRARENGAGQTHVVRHGDYTLSCLRLFLSFTLCHRRGKLTMKVRCMVHVMQCSVLRN